MSGLYFRIVQTFRASKDNQLNEICIFPFEVSFSFYKIFQIIFQTTEGHFENIEHIFNFSFIVRGGPEEWFPYPVELY